MSDEFIDGTKDRLLPMTLDLSMHPKAVRARKLPLPVSVRFAGADGICTTREGDVAYRAGDAILTGVEGEQWPVPRARFEETYSPLEATEMGQPGPYVKGPQSAWALKLEEPASVTVGWRDDPLHGGPGDWLIQYAEGDQAIVAASIFARTYEIEPSSE